MVVTYRSPAALFVIASLIWGSTWLAIKFQLGVMGAEWSVAVRFAIATAVLGGFCVLTKRSLRFNMRAHAFLALQGALLFGFNYIGVYRAEEYATSGLVAVLFSMIVFMNPIGARLLFGAPLTIRTVIAASLGVVGVALLFLPELTHARQGGNAALGIALGLGATMIASGGNLTAMRNQAAGIPVLSGTAWGMFYGTLTAVAMALVLGASWSFDARWPYVSSLLYLAVFGSVIAFGAYLTLLKELGPASASYVNIATPVVAMVFSTLFEGYRWTIVAAFGVVLAVAGNWLALAPARRAARMVARMPKPSA
ncbi:MAG TPA: DMT family transporter [Casimicrobiaceae bacterium]|nr:DMT family transporter [Casimicrobiaceae bacterium]